MSTGLIPILLARMPKREHPKTMRLGRSVLLCKLVVGGEKTHPKVREFAPLTRYGSCCPPAPVLFRAFQIPGWVKEMRPTRMTLNSGLRYHLVKDDTGLLYSTTSWPEEISSMLLAFSLDMVEDVPTLEGSRADVM